MTVDTVAGRPSAVYEGETFHFCSDGCKAKFEADPAAHVSGQAAGGGCCGSKAAQSADAIDPVCGMTVATGAGKPSAVHEGATFHFCSDGCKAKFEADPAAYVSGQAAVGGCCGSKAARSADAIDPVCGMTVDTAAGRPSTVHEGETFHFCSDGCKAKFDADPAAHVSGQAAGGGCCGSKAAQSADAIDPVCGMTVATGAGKPSTVHEGETFHFCSHGCKAKFEADTSAHLAPHAAGGHGCCSAASAGAAGHDTDHGRPTVKDPVCGMAVDPDTATHRAEHDGHAYYFCAARCREKFVADPAAYLGEHKAAPPAPAGAIYTCPMHPEVQQVGPGDCPKCGMALEPMMPSADEDDGGELTAMTRRFWTLLALTAPVFVLAMGPHLFG
jgi:Cu+-exporting ATPase